MVHKISLRKNVLNTDPDRVEAIVAATRFFNDEERQVASELVKDRLTRGDRSEYFFIFAEYNNETIGYVCFGPISGTDLRFYLYWIAVLPQYQHHGIGQLLIMATEEEIKRMGGKKIFVETSSRSLYHSTRNFYLHLGYVMEGQIKDFYSLGDDKVVYSRVLQPE